MTTPLNVLEIAWTVIVPMLDDVPSPSEVKPGWVAVILMVSLVLGTILLWLSMRRQLRKVTFKEAPDSPDSPDSPDAGRDAGPSDDDGGLGPN
jgi:hypothetical protein